MRYKENEFIIVKHSISGVNQSEVELEVPRNYIDELFGSLGIDVWDKQWDDVDKIWKELDGFEYSEDGGNDWDTVGRMISSDYSVESQSWRYRMEDLKDELHEKVEELIHKHKLEQWKYFDWDEYEDGLSNSSYMI